MDYSQFIHFNNFSAKCEKLDADSYFSLATKYPDALLFATALQYEAVGVSIPETATEIHANKVTLEKAFFREGKPVPITQATQKELQKLLASELSYKTLKIKEPIVLYELKETSCPPEQYALLCEQFFPPLHAAILNAQLKILIQKIGIETELKDFGEIPLLGYYDKEQNKGYISQNANMFKQSIGFCQVIAQGVTECVSTSTENIYALEVFGLLSALEHKYNIMPSSTERSRGETIFEEASKTQNFSAERTLKAIHQRFQFSQEQLQEIGKNFVLEPEQTLSMSQPLAEEINASFMKDL